MILYAHRRKRFKKTEYWNFREVSWTENLSTSCLSDYPLDVEIPAGGVKEWADAYVVEFELVEK